MTESACASGRSAAGRIGTPRITFGQGASSVLVITIPVRPLPGPQDCRSNQPTLFRIKLPAPIGNATLLDGGDYPLRIVSTGDGQPSPAP